MYLIWKVVFFSFTWFQTNVESVSSDWSRMPPSCVVIYCFVGAKWSHEFLVTSQLKQKPILTSTCDATSNCPLLTCRCYHKLSSSSRGSPLCGIGGGGWWGRGRVSLKPSILLLTPYGLLVPPFFFFPVAHFQSSSSSLQTWQTLWYTEREVKLTFHEVYIV